MDAGTFTSSGLSETNIESLKKGSSPKIWSGKNKFIIIGSICFIGVIALVLGLIPVYTSGSSSSNTATSNSSSAGSNGTSNLTIAASNLGSFSSSSKRSIFTCQNKNYAFTSFENNANNYLGGSNLFGSALKFSGSSSSCDTSSSKLFWSPIWQIVSNTLYFSNEFIINQFSLLQTNVLPSMTPPTGLNSFAANPSASFSITGTSFQATSDGRYLMMTFSGCSYTSGSTSTNNNCITSVYVNTIPSLTATTTTATTTTTTTIATKTTSINSSTTTSTISTSTFITTTITSSVSSTPITSSSTRTSTSTIKTTTAMPTISKVGLVSTVKLTNLAQLKQTSKRSARDVNSKLNITAIEKSMKEYFAKNSSARSINLTSITNNDGTIQINGQLVFVDVFINVKNQNEVKFNRNITSYLNNYITDKKKIFTNSVVSAGYQANVASNPNEIGQTITSVETISNSGQRIDPDGLAEKLSIDFSNPTYNDIIINKDSNLCLYSYDDGSVFTNMCDSNFQRKWKFISTESFYDDYSTTQCSDCFYIIDDETHMALDSDYFGTIHTSSYNNGVYQIWELIDSTIVNIGTGFALESNIMGIVYSDDISGANTQNWQVGEKNDITTYESTVSNSTYSTIEESTTDEYTTDNTSPSDLTTNQDNTTDQETTTDHDYTTSQDFTSDHDSTSDQTSTDQDSTTGLEIN